MFTLDNYRVKFRYAYEFRDKDLSPKPVDTYCIITVNEKEVAMGRAVCSQADNPDKSIGRKIAFHRALSKLFPDNRDLRRKFWQKYFECTKI